MLFRLYQDIRLRVRAIKFRNGAGIAPHRPSELALGRRRAVVPDMLINLNIQVVAGAIAGYAIGAGVKDINLGALGNTVAGAIGGGVGGQVLQALIPALALATGHIDISSLIGQVVVGGVAGAILTAIIGVAKNKTAGSRLA